jgi:hypothetical protein
MPDEEDQNEGEEKGGADIVFSIRVVDEEGNGVAGAKVHVTYPFTWDEGYTDEDGWISFNQYITMWSGVETTISVNGEVVAGREWIEDGDTFSYTVDN